MFQITGAFADFERSMIRKRVRAGLKLARGQIKRNGHFVTRNGEIRKRLGPPSADPGKAASGLAKGLGIVKVAKTVGLGVGTVAKIKNAMGANA
jgi:DNA invertase Pin-like site-specific DNA recombinase